MRIDELREYCLSKPFTEETMPFGDDVLVFKVAGKMFALISLSSPDTVNLKCDAVYASELRERYTEVQPGFHMNKKLCNPVSLQGSLEEKMIQSLIDHSYEEVFKGLPKRCRRSCADEGVEMTERNEMMFFCVRRLDLILLLAFGE
ncbi:MAG: MmcQ/YjbR family DNA-binding protein [Bacteroidetes bacterium]|nr:MmcQ/YjbR family DNA-binding protein [Bacteroidota bacterium]